MPGTDWNWKAKDGSAGGLLYEPGNWGDLLKTLWLTAVLEWKRSAAPTVNYLDPFAGDVDYPLGKKAAFRLREAALPELDCLRQPFLDKNRWPSAAAAARLLAPGTVEAFDLDPGRRRRWRDVPGVAVPDAASGWDVLADREPDPDAVWLVDPYDFLAEWRQRLPLVLDRAGKITLLVYIYNRSGRKDAAFRDYRAFRNALEDARGDAPKRLGRVVADPFLPRCHHEILFLPGADDQQRPGFDRLLDELARRSARLAAAAARAAAFDC